MLNTSQSVKPAFKIETDLLFHYYTSKLIVLTARRIRYDKWLQRWKQAARADDSPSVRRRGLNSHCQLFIWIRWKRILASSIASAFCLLGVGDSGGGGSDPPRPRRDLSARPAEFHDWRYIFHVLSRGTSNLNTGSTLPSYQEEQNICVLEVKKKKKKVIPER